MRKFSSYGPIDKELYYYAPREELIEKGYVQLVGDNPQKGGHYFTVWAPRQTGKTWVMQQLLFRLKKDPRFHVLKLNLEDQKDKTNTNQILQSIANKIMNDLDQSPVNIENQEDFEKIFDRKSLNKPLILIMDEFDALPETGISTVVSAFRNIYIHRLDETDKPTEQKTYLLHGVALIGVRNVLGIENQKGSPFNVQRSLHIPNLTFDEVNGMFQWYEKDSGQSIEPQVIETLYHETRGQPGLTCWMGELLTEGYENHPNDRTKPITFPDFERIYRKAIDVLPNNNILNIISKAKVDPYRHTVIKLFKTDQPIKFGFDHPEINYLYMNGVIEPDDVPSAPYIYVRFASPFVQKRLFNYFSVELFNELGNLVESFLQVKEIVAPDHIDIPTILKLYQAYLDKNKTWLFKHAPRRSDLRLYEAVLHFNIYAYLDELLRGKGVRVFPEFPTGNGKIDLLIRHSEKIYGIELKSFTDQAGYQAALKQAAVYANQLNMRDIYLVSFIDSIDEENKAKFETPFHAPDIHVTVHPVFIQTGSL
ncbi:MAG: AAA-like domain-containing protein [Candidatus Omnitrophota bacterium]